MGMDVLQQDAPPELSQLICDGQGGKLLVCLGKHIGDEYDVTCKLVNTMGDHIPLDRVKPSRLTLTLPLAVTRTPTLTLTPSA